VLASPRTAIFGEIVKRTLTSIVSLGHIETSDLNNFTELEVFV